jgi:hypothetical protein
MLVAVYLFIIAKLPNRVHYVHLRDLTSEEIHATAVHVGIYALLELASFVMIILVLDRMLRPFSTLRQLAFALTNHWRMTQTMLFVWVLFVIQLSLAHAGNIEYRAAHLEEALCIHARGSRD